MGRKNTSTTKSGKFMNPTDQARKEARRRELKKNKKQRTAVRAAVLKSKDPLGILEELHKLSSMEFDLTRPPPFSEKVLREKHKKLHETWERVMRMYEKEDPEQFVLLRKQMVDYLKKRTEDESYYSSVKEAEYVLLDQIPLPQMENDDFENAQVSAIPLPGQTVPVHGILRKFTQPPGPPVGPPPRKRPVVPLCRDRDAYSPELSSDGGEDGLAFDARPVTDIEAKMMELANQQQSRVNHAGNIPPVPMPFPMPYMHMVPTIPAPMIFAPPSILPRRRPVIQRSAALIEAKPIITKGDVKKFVPPQLRVKRWLDSNVGKEKVLRKIVRPQQSLQKPSKDEVYSAFMKEMEDLL